MTLSLIRGREIFLLVVLLLTLVEMHNEAQAKPCSLDQGAAARGCLDGPVTGSLQSGIGAIYGWVCNANHVEIEIDGTTRLVAAYGTEREDTQTNCGDIDNGFGLLQNWARFGEGPHTVRALADNVEIGRATIVVATLGQEFVKDLGEPSFGVNDFPDPGQNVTLIWQESAQNFFLTNGTSASGGVPSLRAKAVLENPASGSFRSGIGVVSGWVCDATRIDLEVDGTIHWQAPYGTTREDTQGVCGDINNGFAYATNWNRLGSGVHTLRALADGQEFGNATFVVTTLGQERVEGKSKETSLVDFPGVEQQTQVQWQESVQNFLISGATFPGAFIELCTTQQGKVGSGTNEVLVQWRNPCLLSGNTSEVRFQGKTQQALHRATGTFAAADQDGFMLCKDLLEIEQRGHIFTSSDFRLLDQEGNEVTGCVFVPPGTEVATLLQVAAFSQLNFNAPFLVRYNQQPTLEFIAPPPQNPPVLTITPLQIEFASVPVDQSNDQTFTIANTGESLLSGGITMLAVGSGGSEGVFQLLSPSTLTLSPGPPPQDITVP
jgi:hypothetical protein